MQLINAHRACSGSVQHARQSTQTTTATAARGHLHRSSRPLVPQPQQQVYLQQQLQQQQPGEQRQRHLIQTRAGPFDTAPAWTLDQIAGLAFGVVMLAFYFGSKEVDVFIAKQQRKQLGLCERCGGVNDPTTCSEGSCPMRSKAG